MEAINRRTALKLTADDSSALALTPGDLAAADAAQPFGAAFPNLDSLATGEWWARPGPHQNPPPAMDVPREEVVAFALYLHHGGVLKVNAQLFPLRPGEPREARLELKRGAREHHLRPLVASTGREARPESGSRQSLALDR